MPDARARRALTAAVLWSGGKDSTLALDRAIVQGLDARVLFNLYDGESERVRFHGVRASLIDSQARALGLDLLQLATSPARFEHDFTAGLETLRERGVDALVFGNVHLADVRAWYEERSRAAGFTHVEPLWGMAPGAVVREFIGRGYRARVTCIDPARVPRDWLGRPLDTALLEDLQAAPDVDAAGERGEYHTFVHDGPLFRAPVQVEAGAVFELEAHAMLDLVPVDATAAPPR